MAREKAEYSSGGGGEWLNTYADMVTLLLTFFVLLWAMSSTDSEKFDMIVRAAQNMDVPDRIIIVGTALGGDYSGMTPEGEDISDTAIDMDNIFLAIQAEVEESGRSESVEMTQGDGFIFIRFMDDMLFEPNSARLKPSDLELLNFIGYGIKSIQSEVGMISINGHTASVDYAATVSDRMLSTDRANAVLMHFEDQIGITPEKLLAIGWGRQHPIAPNDSEQNRAKNRRVEIYINSENTIGDQLDSVYEKLAGE